MELGNFSNNEFIIFFSLILALVVGALFVTIYYVYLDKREQSYFDLLGKENSTILICQINVKKNQIQFFKKSDIKNKKTTDLISFYNRFHPNDIEKVKNWVFSIFMAEKNVDECIEADILIHNNKKLCFSLLKLLKYNEELGIMHVENHLLKSITPNNSPRIKNNNKKTPVGIVKRSQIAAMIKNNKSLRGYSFCIRFFYLKQNALSNNKIERRMLMTLKNEIYPFANNPKYPRQIMDEGENEMFLFDLRIADKKSAMELATSMSHCLRRQMEVNGFVGYISFSIGCVENGLYYQDFDTIIEKCRETCIAGQTSESEVVMHQRNISIDDNSATFNEQINHIFKKDVLRYLYRPIVGVQNGDTIGYFVNVKAYDSPFSNFQEMIKYSAKVGRHVDLFALTCRNILPKFASENFEHAKLFLNISMMGIEKVSEILNQINTHSETKIVLILDEQEIDNSPINLELLKDTLSKLINEGYELALSLKDKDLLLSNDIYEYFDYFVVGSNMVAEIKVNNRIRFSAYTLIESLLKFDKTIIVTDLEGWQAVELLIKSGITYISSDVISPSNDMLLPIEKKKIEKVIGMSKKYL